MQKKVFQNVLFFKYWMHLIVVACPASGNKVLREKQDSDSSSMQKCIKPSQLFVPVLDPRIPSTNAEKCVVVNEMLLLDD